MHSPRHWHPPQLIHPSQFPPYIAYCINSTYVFRPMDPKLSHKTIKVRPGSSHSLDCIGIFRPMSIYSRFDTVQVRPSITTGHFSKPVWYICWHQVCYDLITPSYSDNFSRLAHPIQYIGEVIFQFIYVYHSHSFLLKMYTIATPSYQKDKHSQNIFHVHFMALASLKSTKR